MKKKIKFHVSAVIKEHRVTDIIEAYTKKQAWYFFAQNNGYAMRDFNAFPLPSGFKEAK